MIQFNLLPDVQLEFIKAERAKRIVVSVSILACAVAFSIMVILLLVVEGVQRKNLSDLDHDIKSSTTQLQNTPNLNKILTIQSQLSTLNTLHDQKPYASRLLQYLGQVTPSSVTISNAAVDFAQHTVTINGNAPSLDAVNTYIDTLKFTTYQSDKQQGDTKAFSNVVLSGFTRTNTDTTYTTTLSYDPIIFDATAKVTLTVPKTITTRSITEQPTDLFKQQQVKGAQ